MASSSSSSSSSSTLILKRSATEKRLINEVFLIKAAFCRVSKRVGVIETFLKSTFDRQFPPRPTKKRSEFSTEFATKVFSSNGSAIAKRRKRRHFLPSEPTNNTDVKGTNLERTEKSDPKTDATATATATAVILDEEELYPGIDNNVGELVTVPASESEDEENVGGGDDPNDISMEEPESPDDVLPFPSRPNSDSDEDREEDVLPSEEEEEVERLKQEIDPILDAEKTAFCHLCGNLYAGMRSVRLLNEHMEREHANVKNYKCSSCDKTFATIELKKKHEKVHLRKPKPDSTGGGANIQCTLCDRVIRGKSRSNLKTHMLTMHATNDDKKYNCRVCGKGFAMLKLKNKHEKYQSCYKTYATTIELKKKKHEKTHLDKPKPDPPGEVADIQCKLCDRVIVGKSRSNLKTHMLTMHATNDDKKYNCRVCGKAFAMIKLRNRHERYHKVRYNCEFCSASYSEERDLKSHLEKREENPDGPCPIRKQRIKSTTTVLNPKGSESEAEITLRHSEDSNSRIKETIAVPGLLTSVEKLEV